MADSQREINWPVIFGTENVKPSYKAQLLKQLEKDLGIFYSSEEADIIFKETAEVVTEALNKNQLTQLLYKIDLNESQAVAAVNSGDPAGELARLILVREAQKVLMRIRYSGK